MIARLIGFLAGLFAGFIITGIVSISRTCDDENDNSFGPRPTEPEKGKGVLITQTMLSEDEQYKSNDE